MKIILCFMFSLSSVFAQTESTISPKKSIKVGTHLSALSTAVPIAYGLYSAENWKNDFGPTIAVGGFIFGPAIGLLYAEDNYKAGRGIFIRSGALFLLNFAESKFNVFESHQENNTAYVIAGIAIAVGAAGVIMDFAAVPSSVRKYNEKKQTSFVPIFDPGKKIVGISVTMRY